ncbi:hypothetical protein ACFOW1_01600 [Parasediminibacterium paludis]|uniref:Uncharacterized protein n=1 Tax=Parasediminibacterium paludis TaxID=908966 RepID=A0ABV8PU17_9BACT
MPTTSVIERPHAICFSRNELLYVFITSDTSPAGLSIQIILFFGGQQFTANLKPDSNGKTYFYINGYIDSFLKYQLPSNQSTFITDAYSAQSVEFYIHYREVTDASTPAYVTSEESSHKRVAFNMGIIREKYSRNNFFANYFAYEKPWLTWLPSGRTVSHNQQIFLSTLILPQHAGKILRLSIVATDIYGNDYVRSDYLGEVPSTGWLKHINVSMAALQIATLTSNPIDYYLVSIYESGTNDGIVSQYQFYVSYDHLYSYTDIHFFNSLGGLDSVRVIGEVETALNKDYTEVDNGIDVNDWLATIKKADTSHVGITTYQSYKGDVGFLEDEAEQDAMTELLISRSIWQYADSRWLPVINLQKSTSLRLSTAKTYSLPIEWRTAITNEVFTPSDVNLGIGTDVETYP